MNQFISTAITLSLAFSALSLPENSSEISLKRKCDSNLDLVKALRNSGVIQDNKYAIDAQERKADLAAKKVKLGINQDSLNERITTIQQEQARGRDDQCLRDSARLIKQLSEYANYATKSEDGLSSFLSRWRAKFYPAEEYEIPIPKNMPLPQAARSQ